MTMNSHHGRCSGPGLFNLLHVSDDPHSLHDTYIDFYFTSLLGVYYMSLSCDGFLGQTKSMRHPCVGRFLG